MALNTYSTKSSKMTLLFIKRTQYSFVWWIIFCIIKTWKQFLICPHHLCRHVPRIFGYAGSQLQSMGPRWNLWRMILDPNDEFLSKKKCDRSLRKKNLFFWAPPKIFLLFFLYFLFSNLIVIYIKFHRQISNFIEKYVSVQEL